MNPIVNNWGPAVVVVVGYFLAYYFQNKRMDEFKQDLYKYIDAKFETVNVQLRHLTEDMSDVKTRLRDLERAKQIIS